MTAPRTFEEFVADFANKNPMYKFSPYRERKYVEAAFRAGVAAALSSLGEPVGWWDGSSRMRADPDGAFTKEWHAERGYTIPLYRKPEEAK